MLQNCLSVVEARFLSRSVAALVLARADGGPLPEYQPGAHISVEPIPSKIRQYSLLGDPAERGVYRIAVKLSDNSHGGSAAIHEIARRRIAGDEQLLRTSSPHNVFCLHASAKHHVLLGAGVGLTPLLSMAYCLRRQGISFSLDYFPGSREKSAFSDFLSGAPFSGQTVSHEGLNRIAIASVLDRRFSADSTSTHYYVCGPTGFMDSAIALARNYGAGHRTHVERFQAATPAAALYSGGGFRIVLARSGREFDVPADRSIVDILEANGIDCPTTCRQGVCGTCVTSVSGGIPDHRDSVLSDEEKSANEVMCVCVSRSMTAVLRLDL